VDETLFWTIIGEAYSPDSVEEAESLRAALGALKWFEVLDFHALFEKFVDAAETPELRAAAFVVNGDASPSAFRNFRLGLVASGKRAYEAARNDADSLADFLDGDPLDGFGLDKVAMRAYEEKTGGSDFYERLAERHPATNPRGQNSRATPGLDEKDLKTLLPRLWNMYHVVEEE
jgi:hypothetical protein